MNEVQYIQINNINIPIVIRSYKTSRHLKMYFKADILYISKPRYISNKKALEFVKENEEYVYDRYTKIISSDNKKLKKWTTGEIFYFKSKLLLIIFKIVFSFFNILNLCNQKRGIFLVRDNCLDFIHIFSFKVLIWQ